eukprot:15017759-Alexandrium_andersonii.AAC.1
MAVPRIASARVLHPPCHTPITQITNPMSASGPTPPPVRSFAVPVPALQPARSPSSRSGSRVSRC